MMGFPGGSVVKNPPTNAGDMDLIPESGRSPGKPSGRKKKFLGLQTSQSLSQALHNAL